MSIPNDFQPSIVAGTISANYFKRPENVRNELLKLANNKDAAWDVSYAVARNINKLPGDARNELPKVADNKYGARGVAYNFDKLPENVQNLLVKLADNTDKARYVADAVSSICCIDNIRCKMGAS